MVVSKDKKYLFSSGDDFKINLWYIGNWQLLCSIKCSFEIRHLKLSLDDCILVGMCRNGEVAHWWIQEQSSALKLNFGDAPILDSYLTPNKEFLLIFRNEISSIVEVWNLKNRIKQTIFNTDNFICTSTLDSRFIFLVLSQNELS